MLKGFRDFLMRGNVVDLAVAVVIGGAFGSVVTSFVEGVMTPFIGVFGGQPDFSNLELTVNGSTFLIGAFLNALLSFVLVAAIIYFFVVTPMNKVMERVKKGESVAPNEKACTECLSMIPLKAKRCKFCTAVVKGK